MMIGDDREEELDCDRFPMCMWPLHTSRVAQSLLLDPQSMPGGGYPGRSTPDGAVLTSDWFSLVHLL